MSATLDEAVSDPGRDTDEVTGRLYALGLTDGLPVVPPTKARIEAMLGGRDPARVVATLAPLSGKASLYRIAICAVMAGYLPEYFPVLTAAVEAVAEQEFNLLGIQTTTGTAAPVVIVNGPAAEQLGFNAGTNALGPGVRANATIGRALALVLRDVGGAIPGELDMATMGQPGKYTFCFAENERCNPWEPLHVSRGFDRDQSTVTVLAAAGTVEVRDECSAGAESLLTTFAHSMLGAGSVGGSGMLSGGEPLLLLSPDHARIVAREKTRQAAQIFLFETARLPLSALPDETQAHLRRRRTVKPGGGVDLFGRTIARVLNDEKIVSKRIQVVNKPGAGGAAGMAEMVQRKGDAYILLGIATHVYATPLTMGTKHSYKDLTPIAKLFSEYQMMVVRTDSPIKSLKQVEAALRKDVGSLKFGGASVGNADHMSVAKFAKVIGGDPSKLTYIAYSGGESNAAILGGHVDVGMGGLDLMDLVEGGKMRVLAVSSSARLGGRLKALPTFVEQGYDVVNQTWPAAARLDDAGRVRGAGLAARARAYHRI